MGRNAMSEDHSSDKSENAGINNVNRRKVLKSLGGAGVAMGAFSVVPGNAAAESDDLIITEVNDERAGRAIEAAKESKEFSKLLEKVRVESEHSILLDESRVFL